MSTRGSQTLQISRIESCMHRRANFFVIVEVREKLRCLTAFAAAKREESFTKKAKSEVSRNRRCLSSDSSAWLFRFFVEKLPKRVNHVVPTVYKYESFSHKPIFSNFQLLFISFLSLRILLSLLYLRSVGDFSTHTPEVS